MRKAAPERALPYYDKDELFATAHLEVDRVKTGEHLIPSELMERGLSDKRLLYAWHGLLRKQQDTLQNKSLARQVASMKARQMLLRPDDSDLADAEALLDKPMEARVSDMTARLRRKFEEMKVIEQAKANAGRKQSNLMLDLDWEDQVDVEGIEELDEDVENDIHSGKRGHEVADKLHSEEALLKRKERMMKERDTKTTGNLEQEGSRIRRRQHTLREMEGTVQASSGVAPAADTSHSKMGGGLMVETLQDSPQPGGASNGVVPTEGSWARVLDMHLAADGFTERYIPGCGRRRCAMHLGLADEVVEGEHTSHTNTGLGLRWKEVGWFRPHEGRQVFNILLIEALEVKREFTPAELARFGIVDLSHSDFVRGTDLKYYRPVPVPKARGNLSVDTALCSRQEDEDTMMPFGSPAQRPSTVSGEMCRRGLLTPSVSPLRGANADRPSTSVGEYGGALPASASDGFEDGLLSTIASPREAALAERTLEPSSSCFVSLQRLR